MTSPSSLPHCVDVAIVGAGFAGLGLGIRLARADRESFVILERGDSVGGTWRDNHYPGVACDVPAHVYSYSFRPPGDWTSLFASGPEIHEYLTRAVDEEGLTPHLHLNTDVAQARWLPDQLCWLVATNAGEMRARVLVVAVGRLADPLMPEVSGSETFSGKVFHTAQWDDEAPIDGARVGIVGTGASAVQLTPHLAERAGELVVFSRSAPYVVPRGNREYSEPERVQLQVKANADRLREELFTEADKAFAQRRGLRPDIDEIRARALGHLTAQIGDPDLRRALTPDYEIGCKRILLSDEFYPALTRPSVTLEPSALAAFDGASVVAASGRSYDLDVVVMATGFEAARPAFAERVAGVGGELLSDHWGEGMVSYASTAVSGFPNMFVLDGPNAALGHNSAIYMIETQIDYVLGALDHLWRNSGLALEVSADAERDYTREIDERSASTVWLSGCSSWYLDPQSGRLTLLWPGTGRSFRERNGTFDPQRYEKVSAVGVGQECRVS
ncbi:cation diffusion facilitator CzcD-associated flavoprotein CzcO [Williamsia muralis]|uniref:Cation diffusion facilitator CzcD-associated flavoprotein CzcO n=1 Tax=Williamsia marianensis TaxID=85044 RepID=A0A495K5H0_WILMA|nr:NAD(P)/FAD-dependent oxidoreductase [Williamsia muralis]RKR96543.1 cation diffusion facilitator CzcD-associated flavoprotein CzcO [Williamsia muralis]